MSLKRNGKIMLIGCALVLAFALGWYAAVNWYAMP
jgi:hypothetical protein